MENGFPTKRMRFRARVLRLVPEAREFLRAAAHRAYGA